MQIYYAKAMDKGGHPVIYYIDENGNEGYDPIILDTVYMKKEDAIKTGISFYDVSDWKTMYGEPLVAVPYGSLYNRRRISESFCSKKGERRFGCKSGIVYNGDIDLVKIWMEKNNHEPMDYLKNPLFYDIEVQSENFMEKYNSMDRRLKYENKILVISFYDTHGHYGVVMDSDERELLRKFYKKAREYSCIIGWNSTDFDFPYIKNRSERLGLKDLNWEMIPEFDLMKVYRKYAEGIKKYYEVVTYRLDDAAKRFLGEDQGKIFIEYNKIDEIYEKDPIYLAKYCLQDSKILVDLYNKVPELKEILHINVMLMKVTKVLPYENSTTFYVTSVLDRMLYNKKIGIPNVGMWEYYGVNATAIGGFVLDPVVGTHHNVVAVDYKSLYPSIMITHNMGMNTYREVPSDSDVKAEFLSFSTNEEGYLAEMMSYYMNLRLEYREKRKKFEKGTPEYTVLDAYQLALKLLINGTNGALTKESLRYYNKVLYNSVVKTGQEYIKALAKVANSLGWKVLYGDTDSVYIKSPYKTLDETVEHVEDIDDILYNGVKDIMVKKYNIPEERYKMIPRTESILSHVFFLSKKMYFMRLYWMDGELVDKFYPKGINVVRQNTLPLLKEVIRNLFENYILTDKKNYESEVIEYLMNMKKKLFRGEADDLITMKQRVREVKNLNRPHFIAARKLVKAGQFLSGDVVEYIQLYDGYVYVPKIEQRDIDYRTYKKYWMKLGSWIYRLMGYKIAGNVELGFDIKPESIDLLSID